MVHMVFWNERLVLLNGVTLKGNEVVDSDGWWLKRDGGELIGLDGGFGPDALLFGGGQGERARRFGTIAPHR